MSSSIVAEKATAKNCVDLPQAHQGFDIFKIKQKRPFEETARSPQVVRSWPFIEPTMPWKKRSIEFGCGERSAVVPQPQ